MEQENLQQAEELNNNEPISPDTLNDETRNEVSVQGQPTPIEKAPEKEVPVWDFSSFNTDEIISHMKSLIDDFPVQRLKVLDSLPQVFEAQYQKEYDKALADLPKTGVRLRHSTIRTIPRNAFIACIGPTGRKNRNITKNWKERKNRT